MSSPTGKRGLFSFTKSFTLLHSVYSYSQTLPNPKDLKKIIDYTRLHFQYYPNQEDQGSLYYLLPDLHSPLPRQRFSNLRPRGGTEDYSFRTLTVSRQSKDPVSMRGSDDDTRTPPHRKGSRDPARPVAGCSTRSDVSDVSGNTTKKDQRSRKMLPSVPVDIFHFSNSSESLSKFPLTFMYVEATSYLIYFIDRLLKPFSLITLQISIIVAIKD